MEDSASASASAPEVSIDTICRTIEKAFRLHLDGKHCSKLRTPEEERQVCDAFDLITKSPPDPLITFIGHIEPILFEERYQSFDMLKEQIFGSDVDDTIKKIDIFAKKYGTKNIKYTRGVYTNIVLRAILDLYYTKDLFTNTIIVDVYHPDVDHQSCRFTIRSYVKTYDSIPAVHVCDPLRDGQIKGKKALIMYFGNLAKYDCVLYRYSIDCQLPRIREIFDLPSYIYCESINLKHDIQLSEYANDLYVEFVFTVGRR